MGGLCATIPADGVMSPKVATPQRSSEQTGKHVSSSSGIQVVPDLGMMAGMRSGELVVSKEANNEQPSLESILPPIGDEEPEQPDKKRKFNSDIDTQLSEEGEDGRQSPAAKLMSPTAHVNGHLMVEDLPKIKQGDVVYRKGRKCEVIKVDYSIEPPSLVVRMDDNGAEVGTEIHFVSRTAPA
eukprot:GEMP01089933.1.p1 GENE.GEMP01089933.1~~GEMP01089933.1.p1  ORF type:complete len:183 (+),score=37.14 GEMP01089933.1:83-631(+)